MKDIFIGNQRILILQGIERNITLSNEMAQRLLRVYGHTLPRSKALTQSAFGSNSAGLSRPNDFQITFSPCSSPSTVAR